jgi:UDP-glucose 4-epimerase
MKEHGVKKIIFASSASVYGKPSSDYVKETEEKLPLTPYAKSKLMCEQIIEDVCLKEGIQYFVLRLFNVAGNNNPNKTALIPKIIDCIESGKELEVYGNDWNTQDGTAIRDYVHVEDVCESIIKCLEIHSMVGIFNIGRGTGHSVTSVIRTAERITGKSLNVMTKPKRIGDIEKIVADESTGTSMGFRTKRGIENIVASEWRAKTTNK